MTNQNGYCLAYRKAWTHSAFNDLLEAAIWNFLYQNAFYEDGERSFNGQVFHLKRGQIVTTPRFLAKGFRISESAARRVIQKLIKLKSIEIQTTTKATIITICNYDKFQLPLKTNDDQTDEQTTHRQKTNDANNNKTINKRTNKNNIDSLNFDIEKLLDDKSWQEARKNAPGWDLYYLIPIFNNWIKDKPEPKNPVGAFISWCGAYTKGKQL